MTGACLLVRRADAEAVGLLDERYFMPVDCAAIRARGRQILFTGDRGRSSARPLSGDGEPGRRERTSEAIWRFTGSIILSRPVPAAGGARSGAAPDTRARSAQQTSPHAAPTAAGALGRSRVCGVVERRRSHLLPAAAWHGQDAGSRYDP